jgi:hypothetical protein
MYAMVSVMMFAASVVVSVEVVATLADGTSVAVRSFVCDVPDSAWSVSKKNCPS